MSQPDARIVLHKKRPIYEPGELLTFEYRVWSTLAHPPTAVEASILWCTEGKGDEDMRVHFFDRVEGDSAAIDFSRPHHFSVALPNTPLSYDGVIVKIRWWVRVRVFFGRERDFVAEEPFRLGHVPPARAIST